MTKQAKNYQRLQHIVEYCEKIKVAAEVFNNSYDTFADDKNYQARDVCSFYILQIGELVGGLTDDFKAENNHIPWRAIKGMRNYIIGGILMTMALFITLHFLPEFTPVNTIIAVAVGVLTYGATMIVTHDEFVFEYIDLIKHKFLKR